MTLQANSLSDMRFVGVDLAWGSRNRTGLAVLDESGTLLDLSSARTDEDILDWLTPYTEGPCLVAIDAPIIVRNSTGRRGCEAQLGAVFGRYDAGAHPTNTGRSEFAHGTRALRIARALDLDVDPRSTRSRRALEVYPHPATVALFGLPRTLKYKHKPGRDLDRLRTESLRLIHLLEGLELADPSLHLDHHAGWRDVRGSVEQSARKVDLKAVEDIVDAVLCAYIGLYAHRRPDSTTVFGDVEHGYIVTPSLRPTPASPEARRDVTPRQP